MQSLTIPERLPGLNDIIKGAKHSPYVYAKEKRRLTDLVCLLAMAGLKPVTEPAYVHCHWYEHDLRRDPDNIAAGIKFVLDGLVLAKILPDDNRTWITGLQHTFHPIDRRNPRVVVEIS